MHAALLRSPPATPGRPIPALLHPHDVKRETIPLLSAAEPLALASHDEKLVSATAAVYRVAIKPIGRTEAIQQRTDVAGLRHVEVSRVEGRQNGSFSNRLTLPLGNDP